MNKKFIPLALTLGLFFVGAGCIGVKSRTTATIIDGPGQVIDGVYPSNANASVGASTNAAAAVNAGGNANAAAATEFNFTGAVVDANTFKPIPGAAVNLKEASIRTTTDINGRYKLTLSGPSVSTATAAKDHYKAGSAVTLDTKNGPFAVDLTLTPEQRVGHVTIVPDAVYVAGKTGLKVTVKDSVTGKGVADIGLLTVAAAVPGANKRVTAADGTFTDTEIPPGTYMFDFLKFDSSAHETYKLDFAEAVNDYIITVMDGYTTEVTLSITK